MLSGGPAVAALAESRLNLLSGEWWENRSWGNRILQMMRSSRLTCDKGTVLLSHP
jgi:hypothetical protein